MARKTHRKAGIGERSEAGSEERSVFDRMAEAGSRCYSRARDLPCVLALWPQELADFSPEGGLRVLSKLRQALRAERRRARAAHWSYDLNRHLALLSAYKGELALLRAATLSRNEPGAAKPTSAGETTNRAAKHALRLPRQAR